MARHTRRLIGVLGAAAAALASGCVVETGPLAYYEAGCFDSSDCVPGAACYTLTSGDTGETDTMCSGSCNVDADCGTNGWCILQYAATSICFEACNTGSDCEVGWRCEGVEDFETRTVVRACIPGW